MLSYIFYAFELLLLLFILLFAWVAARLLYSVYNFQRYKNQMKDIPAISDIYSPMKGYSKNNN